MCGTQSLYGRVAEFLGPAHGFAGNVHALRGYVGDEILRDRVTQLLERTALRDGDLVNWPPVTPSTGRSDAIRVQWCHGAPGIVTTLGDLMPLELAVAAGELTWRAGPLRKGGGLCHCTAGNGFTFLKLFVLTGDERWLARARRFAMHAVEQIERERRRVGWGRYTLWTGDIGVALYLRACINADPAFPDHRQPLAAHDKPSPSSRGSPRSALRLLRGWRSRLDVVMPNRRRSSAAAPLLAHSGPRRQGDRKRSCRQAGDVVQRMAIRS